MIKNNILKARLVELGNDKYYGTKIELLQNGFPVGQEIVIWVQSDGHASTRQLKEWDVETEEIGFAENEPSCHYEEKISYDLAKIIVDSINDKKIEITRFSNYL